MEKKGGHIKCLPPKSVKKAMAFDKIFLCD